MTFIKRFSNLFFLVAISSTCFAQNGGMEIQDHLLIRESRRFTRDTQEARYEGSPYMNDEFRQAFVHSGNLKFQGVPMRYNVVEDVMEFQNGALTYLLDPDPKIARIELGEETFVVPRMHKSFYVSHKTGNLSLLSKSVVNLRPANDLMGIPAKYGRQPDVYYFMLGDSQPVKVSGLKGFLELIPGKKKEMEKFARDEKISFRNKGDLLKLVEHFNSISM
jgi:hypothetical protein